MRMAVSSSGHGSVYSQLDQYRDHLEAILTN
jgi:hypothetical protein